MSSVEVRLDHREVVVTGDPPPAGSADARVLWAYQWASSRRPFLHPVATPAGHVLSRDAPPDHPWHHGLWFTIKFVNGENFWEEYDSYGVLRHEAAPAVDRRPGNCTIDGVLHWLRPDRVTVAIEERRQLTHCHLGQDSYAIDMHTELTPTTSVVLDRTPFTTWGGYGGLAFRGRGDFHDTRLLLADGRSVDRVLGERGDWLDLSGIVGGADGDVPAGITILEHPSNPRHGSEAPVPWYGATRSATYGDEGWSNFVNAAFLWDGPLEVAAGETLAFDHRVIVHDGIWDHGQVQAAFDRWNERSRAASS